MPVRPTPYVLDSTSMDILNVIRKQNGGLYQTVVPIAEQNGGNLKEVGTAIMSDTQLKNAFLNALINRIGRVLITSKTYENPWAGFKKGLMEYGETVEEIFVNIATPYQYDPEKASETLYKRHIPDVKSEFHPMNYQKEYPITVSNDQLRQAFLSSAGITDLIGRIIDSIYTAVNYDELIMMKYLVAKMCTAGRVKAFDIPIPSSTTAKEIVSTIKGISNDMEYLKSDYNPAKVKTLSLKNDQFLIMNAKFDATIDVEVLASAFNMEKAQFMGHRVGIDNFHLSTEEMERLSLLMKDDPSFIPLSEEENNIMKDVPCVLLDRDWFMVFDNLLEMTEAYNGKGLYWNYFYHTWKTFSVSPFSNAVLFTSKKAIVKSVTVLPNVTTIKKGNSKQFIADVIIDGIATENVIWEINSTLSTIDKDGILKVASNETAETLTVTATSKQDIGKTGTATVTVVA